MHDKNKKGLKVFELDADVNLVFLIMFSIARLKWIKILFVFFRRWSHKKRLTMARCNSPVWLYYFSCCVLLSWSCFCNSDHRCNVYCQCATAKNEISYNFRCVVYATVFLQSGQFFQNFINSWGKRPFVLRIVRRRIKFSLLRIYHNLKFSLLGCWAFASRELPVGEAVWFSSSKIDEKTGPKSYKLRMKMTSW